MKYLAFLTIFISISIQANVDRCPIATASNITGLWQAFDMDKNALYILKFNKDGTSSLSASTLYGKVWFGESTKLSTNNSGISLSFYNRTNIKESVVVNGFGVSGEESGILSLVLDGQQTGHIFRYQNLNFHKGSLVENITKIQNKIDAVDIYTFPNLNYEK
ncbi:hypothetical protein ACRWQM_01370 [Shewanella sp. HL-SH5]|uniref:hypothetical protein n=1 Tax=Shewanella sp. HL-SH5 TaxID=3436241 RepID=UPI003EBCBDD7